MRPYSISMLIPLFVLFLPEREDLGLVTLEAFMSGKPVITCVDSGEPARLVQDGESGFVCLPDPRAIATRIDELASEPSRAAAMGEAGGRAPPHHLANSRLDTR